MHTTQCDECGYELPDDQVVDGLCDLCYDELFGEDEPAFEKFTRSTGFDDE